MKVLKWIVLKIPVSVESSNNFIESLFWFKFRTLVWLCTCLVHLKIWLTVLCSLNCSIKTSQWLSVWSFLSHIVTFSISDICTKLPASINQKIFIFPYHFFASMLQVTLEPGDVLFVPKKWWHYVESLETSISINTWIELVSVIIFLNGLEIIFLEFARKISKTFQQQSQGY